MKDQRSRAPASVDNIYRLDGRVPVGKAIPFGLQHVLAMFVANVTPVMLIAGVAVYNGEAFTAIDTALLIQAAMLIAGIGTLIQLYPVWRIGSRLPVVMGLSFTFLSAMMTLASRDYGLMIGERHFRRQPRRGRVRDSHDPVFDAAQKGQDGGCRRADRGHHRQQKAGINA